MEPILVPVISYYIGNLTRTTLDVVFWYIFVRKDLLTCGEPENKVYILIILMLIIKLMQTKHVN